MESDRGSGLFVEGNPGILDIAHTTRRLESGQVGADEAGEKEGGPFIQGEEGEGEYEQQLRNRERRRCLRYTRDPSDARHRSYLAWPARGRQVGRGTPSQSSGPGTRTWRSWWWSKGMRRWRW